MNHCRIGILAKLGVVGHLVVALGLLGAKETVANEELAGISPDTLLNTVIENSRLGKSRDRVSHVVWGPNGKTLIIGIRDKNTGDSNLLGIEVESGKVTPLGFGAEPEVSPKNSYVVSHNSAGVLQISQFKDSKLTLVVELPFLAKDKEFNFLNIAPRYAWNPDGRRLAYIRILDTWREDADIPNRSRVGATEVRIYDVLTGQDQSVYSSNLSIDGVTFGPDGRLYYSQGQGFNHSREVAIAYVDIGSAQPVTVADDIGYISRLTKPTISPDGRYLGLVYSPDKEYFNFPQQHDWAIIDLQTGARRIFSDGPFSSALLSAQWLAGSSKLVFRCKLGAFWNVLCLAGASDKNTETLKLEAMADIHSFSLSQDGKQVAWVSRDLTDTIRVRIANVDGSNTRTIFQQARADLSNTELGEVRAVRWTSFDGLELEGLLILPVGYQEGTRVALIVNVHGGPGGGVRIDGATINASPLEYQMWAAKGYAVFVADYRLGKVAARDLSKYIRPNGMTSIDPDARDVLAGVEHIVATGIADPDRIAIIGHSYGAHIVNWLITITDRFAAAVSKEGISDFRVVSTDPTKNPMQYKTYLFLLNATPDTLDQTLWESSAIVHAHRIRTPVLVVAAEHGFGIDPAQEFVQAINDEGGRAELLHFQNELHAIQNGENIKRLLDKTIGWFDQYIGNAHTPSH